MRDKSSRISRRLFLEKSVCGAALAGTATVLSAWSPLNPLAADDELLHEVRGKVSKASARYRDRPNGDQQCSGCTHFRGGTCEIVEGRISSDGWCRHFKRKGGGGKSSGGSSGKSSGGSSSGSRPGY